MRLTTAVLLCVLLSACGEQGAVKIAGKAAPESGMVKTLVKDDVTYRVEYLPAYQKMLAAKTGAVNDSSFCYFRFNIKSARFEKEKEMVEYMNYRMQQDFTLKVAADSIPCVFYQAIPRGFGGEYEFLVAFENGPATVMQFVYTDRVLKNEQFVFPYTSKDFEKKAE